MPGKYYGEGLRGLSLTGGNPPGGHPPRTGCLRRLPSPLKAFNPAMDLKLSKILQICRFFTHELKIS